MNTVLNIATEEVAYSSIGTEIDHLSASIEKMLDYNRQIKA